MKWIIMALAIILTGSACKGPEPNTVKPKVQNKDSKASEAPGAYAEVNGLKMYYEVHGKGFPLVLIHGGGSTIETTWGRVLDQLARQHQVIALEIQAHGRTSDRAQELTFENDADDVAALLNSLKIPKADVFGFSNGASTTLQMAIRHPEMVNRIVVASTFFNRAGAQPWFFDMMSKPSFETMPQQFKDAFLKVNNDSNALHRMYERDVYRMQHFPDITDAQMKAITAPAFIISGTEDVNTIEHAVEMHRLLKNSWLAILPGGHGDYIGEITTPQDSTLIEATVSMVHNFLLAKKKK